LRITDEIDLPLLWVIPFAVFTLLSLMSLVNVVLHFLPSNSGHIMMILASGFICASAAGFITESIKGKCNYVYISMGVSILVGAAAFLVTYSFFKTNSLEAANIAAVPGVNEIISNITLTLLPGLFVGAMVGGGIGLIPEEPDYQESTPLIEKPSATPEKIVGYEKVCRRCGALMPYDSLFCSQCGGTLKKRRAETMKYCRYCGHRLYFLGEFCPDCGKEINIVSKPKVFVSDQ